GTASSAMGRRVEGRAARLRPRTGRGAGRTCVGAAPSGDLSGLPRPDRAERTPLSRNRRSILASHRSRRSRQARIRNRRGGTELDELATVDRHREGVRGDEHGDTPRQGDPQVGADGLPCVQVADRVDDGSHRLVVGEGPHRAWHASGEQNAELMKGKKMSGYENALAPSTLFADRPTLTASHVNASVNTTKMPAIASHAAGPALDRKPITTATSTTTTS